MEYTCPKCGSADVYFSKKKQCYICEDCDTAFEVTEERHVQKIFFSYGHDDNEQIVLKIKRALEERGHTIWIDKSEIRGGDDWRRKITDGLMDTSSVISFLSAHSVRTPGVCLDELKIALCVKRGFVKTVLLESEETVKVPTTVSDVQWLDLSRWREVYDRGGEEWNSWFEEKLSAICAAVESEEATTFTGEIQKLKEYLSPNLLDTKEQSLLEQQYIGRSWLNDAVRHWIDHEPRSHAFVLIAGPGIGKSNFAANMLHYTPDVLCGIFCEWDKPQTVNAKSVIRTIAFRLASKLPDYRRLLIGYFTDPKSRMLDDKTPEELFSILLEDPLGSLIDGGRAPCVIVIDGLDEAATTEGDRLMRLLADRLSGLPRWVKFILTSRPEHGVEHIFREYNPTVILPDDRMNRSDIREYLARNLKEQLAETDDKMEILDTILERSEGSFLYATLFVRGVLGGTMSLSDTATYPVGLSGIYYKNFKRHYPDSAAFGEARGVLELVVAARLLPVDFLDLFGIDRYAYRRLKDGFGSLLSEVTIHVGDDAALPCITFSHKSIRDWLVNDAAGEFYVDSPTGAARLAETLTPRLAAYGLKRLAKEKISPQNALLKFAERHLAAYHLGSGNLDRLEAFLLSPDTPFLPYWMVLAELPAARDLTPLVKRLSVDPDSVSYFRHLQRTGDISLAVGLLEQMSVERGVAALSRDHFKVFTDLVHLSGEYARAVKLNEDYLAPYSREEIIADKDLMAIKTRMLHHSKFFLPADRLRAEVDELLETVTADNDCDAYLELLIMGGNLGTLTGDIPYATRCNDETLRVARARDKHSFELRAVRKKADLLKYDHRYNEAFSLLGDYVSIDGETPSRYEIYLLCSLGEMHRLTGNFEGAYTCYERVKRTTAERGIWGWWAHAMLALGCLMLAHGHDEEARVHFLSALARYKKIGQVWGVATVNLHLEILAQKNGASPDLARLDTLAKTAERLGYHAYLPYIERLRSGAPVSDIPLMFI